LTVPIIHLYLPANLAEALCDGPDSPRGWELMYPGAELDWLKSEQVIY
jgi:hypothetical protein